MERKMKVRSLKLDFLASTAHWSPHKEFAQIYNAASTVPAYIEPYLVKVMLKAKEMLGPKHEKLHEDLTIFIRQEMQHCKQHLNFNKSLHAKYPKLLEMETAFEKDYVDLLANRSLRFNCAYSEGFEAMSAIGVSAWFENFDEFIEEADPEVVELWKWHLAEEYEHRTVAHEVFQKLFGGNPIFAYFYRIYGFFYALKHIKAHTDRVCEYLLSVDREGMTEAEIAASRERYDYAKRLHGSRAKEHLRAILSPFYQPGKRKPPRDRLKRGGYAARLEKRFAACVMAI
jgi:predicted metal-dependent hydrolase